jgi:hypothetical protein
MCWFVTISLPMLELVIPTVNTFQIHVRVRTRRTYLPMVEELESEEFLHWEEEVQVQEVPVDTREVSVDPNDLVFDHKFSKYSRADYYDYEENLDWSPLYQRLLWSPSKNTPIFLLKPNFSCSHISKKDCSY